jgi:hypothetical protein
MVRGSQAADPSSDGILTRSNQTVRVTSTAGALASEGIMTLHFLGIDPATETGDSPTVWFDDDTREFVFQGWKVDDDLRRQGGGRVFRKRPPRTSGWRPSLRDLPKRRRQL